MNKPAESLYPLCTLT